MDSFITHYSSPVVQHPPVVLPVYKNVAETASEVGNITGHRCATKIDLPDLYLEIRAWIFGVRAEFQHVIHIYTKATHRQTNNTVFHTCPGSEVSVRVRAVCLVLYPFVLL